MWKLPPRLLMKAIRPGSPGKLARAAPETAATAMTIPVSAPARAGADVRNMRRMSSSSGLTQPAWICVGKHPVAIEEQRGDNQPWMLEFRLLGPVEAIADSASLDLGGPKQRAVLALLLLHANE